MSNRNRQKGHNLERLLARIFRDLGFKHAKTSRQANRLADDCGVDLVNIPLAIQAKAGYKNRRPKFDQLYKETKEKLNKNFPPEDPIHDLPYVVVHKIDGRRKENFYWMIRHEDAINFIKDYLALKKENEMLKK